MTKVLRENDKEIKIKPYKEMMEYYEDYIIPLREFFKKNPEKRKKIFDV